MAVKLSYRDGALICTNIYDMQVIFDSVLRA